MGLHLARVSGMLHLKSAVIKDTQRLKSDLGMLLRQSVWQQYTATWLRKIKTLTPGEDRNHVHSLEDLGRSTNVFDVNDAIFSARFP